MPQRPVLVIEDHSDTRHMVEEYLRFQGIPAVGAESGLEGLTVLRHTRPAVILLDLSMPIMDGWRFRKEQQSLNERDLAATPVVVLSAFHNAEREADALGAVDFIPKPIEFDRLLDVVRRYYESSAD